MAAREYGFRSLTRLKAYIEKFGEDLREGYHPVVLTTKDVTVLPEVFPRQDYLCLTSKNSIRFDTEENLAIHLDLLGEAHRVHGRVTGIDDEKVFIQLDTDDEGVALRKRLAVHGHPEPCPGGVDGGATRQLQ
tara:strand:+ start:2767 stop:3165 length:399 start_codon:yes stop_codon:yes gene_type:complete